MASSPTVQDGPEGSRGQKKNSADQPFDRKTKTRFHVFSPAPSTGSFSSNCIKAESAIAAAIDAVDKELFSQLTDDINGSELKSCTYLNKPKDGRDARFCTKFELYSARAVELFLKTFPLNRRASNPDAGYTYSWPDQPRFSKSAPRTRQPEDNYMALSIRGGQKIPKDALTTALSSAGATLCSTLPLRGHGFKTVSMNDSLAIIKCVRPPKNITVGDKPVPLFVITPVDPESTSANPSKGSYAAAAARAAPPAAYQVQAWHAIKDARSQTRGGVFTDGNSAAVRNAAAVGAAGGESTAGGEPAAGKAKSPLNTADNSGKENSDGAGASGDRIMDENISLREKFGNKGAAEGGADAEGATAAEGGATAVAAGGAADAAEGGAAAEVEEGELLNTDAGSLGQENNSDADNAVDEMEKEDQSNGDGNENEEAGVDADNIAQEQHIVVDRPVTRSATTPRANGSPTKRKAMASTTSPSSVEPQRKSPRKTPRKILAALRIAKKVALPAPEGADGCHEKQQE